MMDMHETVLHTENLSIGYRIGAESYAVHSSLNLDLKRGEMVCLVGPNGSGKSTLLRTIAGLQPALNGNVFIQGKCIDDLSVQQLAHLRSVVLTSRFDCGYMTVSELVSLGRFPHLGWLGRLSTRDRHHVAEAIALTGISHLNNRRLSQLSDGELQRAMIAKALAQESPVILLDEPTAHLDLPNRVAVMKLLQGLARETATAIVLSTHELDLAMQSADRFWLMSAHNEIRCGVPEELALEGEIAQAFNSENVHFDTASGIFVMHNKNSGEIGLSGAGAGYLWTKRALERVGFTVTSAQNEITVESVGSGYWWTLDQNGIRRECDSLAVLLEMITSGKCQE